MRIRAAKTFLIVLSDSTAQKLFEIAQADHRCSKYQAEKYLLAAIDAEYEILQARKAQGGK